MSEYVKTFTITDLSDPIISLMTPKGARILEFEPEPPDTIRLHMLCRDDVEDAPRVFFLRGSGELHSGQEGDYVGYTGSEYFFEHWSSSPLRQDRAYRAVANVVLADESRRADAMLALEEIQYQDSQPAGWTDWEIVQRLKRQREDRDK